MHWEPGRVVQPPRPAAGAGDPQHDRSVARGDLVRAAAPHWQRDADGWRGFDTISTGVDQQRFGWFPADPLRPGLPDGDHGGEVDAALKVSDRPAVADRPRPGQP